MACYVCTQETYRRLRKDSLKTARESVAAQALAWVRKLDDIERKLRDASLCRIDQALGKLFKAKRSPINSP
ncbi:hypothetical protein [Burkholderia diffusa]|uniref:hypothetical protein n=1 Tax=Burkholderia diffusa TaxID=488732 RepID=UPI00157AE9BF|nr:hypothetical protein [Burkholderia diffusa]NTY41640.1 hypothetical protein [Burkholderia diffusa]